MARKKKEKRTYKYECTLSGEEFIVTEKAKHPDELVSVKGYYELNQDKDDRPADIKKLLGIESAE